MSNPGLIRDKKTRELRDISTDSKIRLGQTEVIGGLPTVEINQSNWGTFGIAFQGSTGSQAYGLVNSHFADGNMVQPPFKPTQEDQPIWSIGDVVAGKSFEGDIRGDSASERYYVDAALIALNDKRSFVMGLVHDFSDDPFLFANSFLRYTDPKTGRVDAFIRVFKFGARTLERLEGQLENPQDSVVLRKKRIGSVIRARRSGGYFTLPGDSGSALIAPIYDKISKRARFLVVGLCFAGVEGDASILYACHFAAVKKALKLDIPKSQLRDDWAYSKP